MLCFFEAASFYLFFLKFQAVVMILFMSISAVNFAPTHCLFPSSFFTLVSTFHNYSLRYPHKNSFVDFDFQLSTILFASKCCM